MKKEIMFAWYAIKMNIRGNAELRASFLLNMIGMMINNSAFLFLWVFFAKTVGSIGGWTSLDVIGMMGFSTLSYGIIESCLAGLRNIPDYIASGVFDRFLLSPKNVLLRAGTSMFGTSAVGDALFGILCIGIYLIVISASFLQIGFVLAGVVLASCVFFSVVVLIASVGFLFEDANPITQSLWELFLTPSLFHGGAFQGILRAVFIYIVPGLVVGTLPLETVKNTSYQTVALIAVLSIVWLLLSLWLFSKALKKYESSNFITFGL